jgi:hypothetical protein
MKKRMKIIITYGAKITHHIRRTVATVTRIKPQQVIFSKPFQNVRASILLVRYIRRSDVSHMVLYFYSQLPEGSPI